MLKVITTAAIVYAAYHVFSVTCYNCHFCCVCECLLPREVLHYYNLLFSRLSESAIEPLQRVVNAAARIIMNLSLCNHAKPALKLLHWPPVVNIP